MLLDRLYGSITATRNLLYDRGILNARRLARPVISVGNISTGGSGKTPLVIALGELLARRNTSFDVLSRGYRRSSHGVLEVDPKGTPLDFGDEPLLIARKLGCPVIVAEDRYAGGLYAERRLTIDSDRIHLLDDGFQHRRLHRDFDIVLLNREDLDDDLLPTGRLREPLSSLNRADAVVLDSDFPSERLPKGNFAIFRVERVMDIPHLRIPVIAFCGIARPQRFFSALRKGGIDVREEIVFHDHHRYTAIDLRRLEAARARIPDSCLITTEKDAINLRDHLIPLNPIVVPIKTKLLDSEAAVDAMLMRIAARSLGFSTT